MGKFILRQSTDTLSLNPSGRPHYVIEKSEKQGIRELRNLAMAAGKSNQKQNEENWLFIEGRDEQGRVRSFWFEAGINETPTSTQVDTKSYQEIKAFLKKIMIKPERSVDYHYHPDQKVSALMGSHGFLPSPSDLKLQFALHFTWYLRKMEGPLSSAVVTSRGVWRSDWTGGPIKNPTKFQKVKARVDKRVERAFRYHEEELHKCASRDTGFCQELFQSMGDLLSNRSFRIFYQAFPNSKIPSASFSLLQGTLLATISSTQNQGLFEEVQKYLEKINHEQKGENFKILYADPESWVGVETTPSQNKRVRFQYVIDTNSDPKDGRLYLRDSFYFSKGGKYLPNSFFRSSNYYRSMLIPKFNSDQATDLQKLATPTKSEQKRFAETVASALFSKDK